MALQKKNNKLQLTGLVPIRYRNGILQKNNLKQSWKFKFVTRVTPTSWLVYGSARGGI